MVAVCGDIGQGGDELTGLKEKALQDRRLRSLRRGHARGVRLANTCGSWSAPAACTSTSICSGTSIARPLLAKKQVEVALATGCDALAHGCTGKGNDQVRFELTYKALAPHLPVIAPWREWDIISREDAIEYAQSTTCRSPQSTKKIYSRDRNIWHISHEGGALEDPANAAPDDIWMLTKSPAGRSRQARRSDHRLRNRACRYRSTARQMRAFALLEALNQIGGEHGVGRIDLVENRFVGMKSRGCYETPGGTLIMAAARELEALTLEGTRCTTSRSCALDYAEMVYNGLWFTPLCAKRSTRSSKP